MASIAFSPGVSPDRHAAGIVSRPLDALRYDGHSDDPAEVAGTLRALMPSDVSVLDVGCGTGSVDLIVNHGRGNRVVAIESDADRVRAAAARGIDVRPGYLDEDFVAHNKRFDVVMASDVLEHVPDPAQLLSLMIRAARPGGLLLLSVPNVAHWSVRFNLLRGRFDYEDVGIMDATHLRWFTEKTFRALIAASGAELVDLRHTAGTSLSVYRYGKLRRIPARWRDAAVRRLTRLLPRLFAVQHVAMIRTPGG